MKKFLLFLFSLLIFTTLFALILNPNKYVEICLSGLKVWALTVVPSLLPFVFLTFLLSNLLNAKFLSKLFNGACKFLYRENGLCGYVQFMSFISGYPIGSKLIGEFTIKKLLSKKNAEKISVCASTSGPSFIITAVGFTMLNDCFAGIILFFCHILSAIINGIIFRKYAVYQPIPPLLQKKENCDNILLDCAISTFTSCLTIGVFIAFFFVETQVLQDCKILLPLNRLFTVLFADNKKATAFTAGLIECTQGCILMANTSGILKLPLICALISFGGASVIVQSIAFLKQANLSVKPFLLGKIIQAFSSFLACLLVCLALGYN